ncbi:MAG: C40 family peptidase [Ignavibacteriales bacterium]|nr:C40 family peptidase [Ignavibacteriales bacterium]
MNEEFHLPYFTKKPRRFSGLYCSYLLCVAAFLAFGCVPSSPRFGNGGKKESTGSRSTAPRFSSREVEEETKENDKIPDKKTVEKVVSGERDFRREKNESIAPLDRSKMMREISKYMGVPYLHGGTTMKGIDCSAYTMAVYEKSVGRKLSRSAHEQYKGGTAVSFKDLKFGDLVFFTTTGERASHVGIYLGDDLFAHASVSLGVTISSLQSSYYEKRYEGARRMID